MDQPIMIKVNLIVDERYPGLSDKGTVYTFEGDIQSEGNIEIRLDKTLSVTGNIRAGKSILSIKSIETGGDIKAVHNIRVNEGGIKSRSNINADRDIEAAENIKADLCINATGNIKSGKTLTAGWDILSGANIEAGYGIASGGCIRAENNIKAVNDIRSEKYIRAGMDISAGWGILAGMAIKCGGNLSAGYGIFAGICTWRAISDTNMITSSDNNINCNQLVNGSVQHGILIEIKANKE
jgi:hypothetical protein